MNRGETKEAIKIKPKPRELWVNVYVNAHGHLSGYAYSSEDDARYHCGRNAQTIKVREIPDDE